MITTILYVVAFYTGWWAISRGALIAAWLYSKPGKFTARHYALTAIGFFPFLFELIASILVIFSVAFGIDPRREKKDG
jgi:hypothetical protein